MLMILRQDVMTLKRQLNCKKRLRQFWLMPNFHLRKWVTNDMKFLKQIPIEHREGAIIEKDIDPTVSTLGMLWHFKSDVFELKLSPRES